MKRLAATLAAVSLLAAAPPARAEPRAPGQTPEAGLEEGLWALSAEAEQGAKESAERIRDPGLETYLHGVMCRLSAEHCADIRIYPMNRPFFNASMAPNGYMEVWAGLMLRAQSEAELAFVLGHEAGHYLENHSVESWRAAKDRQTTAMILGAVVAVAGAAAAGNAGSAQSAQAISDATGGIVNTVYLGALVSIFGYSREQETEADATGHALAVKAGYEPDAGAALWKNLLTEIAASDFERTRRSAARASLFATHPIGPDRVEALNRLSAGLPDGETGADSHRAAIRPHLLDWLKDDLRRRDFGQTLHLIDRLAAGGEDLGVLEFMRGEVHRLRRRDGDAEKALTHYLAATAHDDAPPAAFRQIGEARESAKEPAAAREAYETYLARDPDCEDRLLIERRLARLTGETDQ